MNLSVYDKTGAVGTMTIDPIVDQMVINSTIIHQMAMVEAANQRQSSAHTKTRGEVRGGGHKPWKQKGTGRARQSSIRSPIWVGGGIAFGPLPERNFSAKMPKKMRQTAFKMVLAAQLKAGLIRVITDIDAQEKMKTKTFATMLKNLPQIGRRVLIILDALHPQVVLATNNLPNVLVAQAQSVRTTELLVADTILVTETSLGQLVHRAFGEAVTVSSMKPAASTSSKETSHA